MTQVTLSIMLRGAWTGRTAGVKAAGDAAVDRPIRGAVLAILTVCGYMALFGALAGALGEWIGHGPADAVLCLLDVPSGALRVSNMALPETVKLSLLSGMCGFGGMCVITQSLGALKGSGVNAGEYMGLRALAGLISAGYMAMLQKLPSFETIRLIEPIQEKPLAAGMLFSAILAVPVLAKRIKSIS